MSDPSAPPRLRTSPQIYLLTRITVILSKALFYFFNYFCWNPWKKKHSKRRRYFLSVHVSLRHINTHPLLHCDSYPTSANLHTQLLIWKQSGTDPFIFPDSMLSLRPSILKTFFSAFLSKVLSWQSHPSLLFPETTPTSMKESSYATPALVGGVGEPCNAAE